MQCDLSALPHDKLGVCRQEQARTVQEKKRKAVVPHGMHGLAPRFSFADSHVLPLVHSVEKLDVYSPVHGLSISKVTQILRNRGHNSKILVYILGQHIITIFTSMFTSTCLNDQFNWAKLISSSNYI